jgi:hypothetical protein
MTAATSFVPGGKLSEDLDCLIYGVALCAERCDHLGEVHVCARIAWAYIAHWREVRGGRMRGLVPGFTCPGFTLISALLAILITLSVITWKWLSGKEQ